MVNTEYSTDSRKPTLVPLIAENEAWTGTIRAGTRPAVASPSRRFDRVSIGFWLGGATLGTGGCILGGCMPYHHPVAIAISVIWWGIYIGCFGASLGGLFGLFTHCAPSSGRTEAVSHPPTEEHSINWSPHSRCQRSPGASLMNTDQNTFAEKSSCGLAH
jgi:hypothetical protein